MSNKPKVTTNLLSKPTNLVINEDKKQKVEDWEKEFKKKFFFENRDGYFIPNPSPETISFMKNFIRSLLSLSQQELIGEIKEFCEKNKLKDEPKLKDWIFVNGFNKALNLVLNSLTERKI